MCSAAHALMWDELTGLRDLVLTVCSSNCCTTEHVTFAFLGRLNSCLSSFLTLLTIDSTISVSLLSTTDFVGMALLDAYCWAMMASTAPRDAAGA